MCKYLAHYILLNIRGLFSLLKEFEHMDRSSSLACYYWFGDQ